MLTQADDSSFEREVFQHPGAVLVDFYTPTCGPCRQLEPELRQLSEQIPGVKVVKVDATKAPQVAAQFGVRSVPVLIAFRNGEQIQRLNGKPPMQRLRQLMQSI
jgi:thioredoxin 1